MCLSPYASSIRLVITSYSIHYTKLYDALYNMEPPSRHADVVTRRPTPASIPPMTDTRPDPLDPATLLRWYVAMGVDLAVEEEPVDRTVAAPPPPAPVPAAVPVAARAPMPPPAPAAAPAFARNNFV